MSKNRLVFLGAALCALATFSPRPARAVGEQFARVRGVVTNEVTGESLEGVTVEATSSALIGPSRTTMTMGNGRYELNNLPPGDYTLSFSYPGTVPAVRKLTLLQGESATLNLDFDLQSQETETVTVTSRQLTKPDSAQTGAVREVATANKLPTGRSYQGLATQVPGTSGGANPNIKGGSTRQNKYLIDGMDVSDPLLSTFAQNLTFDSMQSVEVITGGMDAEYNALGGIINVITRGGSEKFHGEASVYVNHQKLSAKGTYGPNSFDGYQPFNETQVGANQSVQASFNVGGPILHKKLWYGATYEFIYTEASAVKGPPLGVPPFSIQHPPRVFTGHNVRLNLSYAVAPKHMLWLSARTDPATITNIDQGNTRLGVAEDIQKQGGYTVSGGWDWTISERLTAGLQIGFLHNFLDNTPMGWVRDIDTTGCDQFAAINCKYDRNRPQHVNLFDNTTWHQGGYVSFDRRDRLQIDPYAKLKLLLLGTHNLKTGIQTQILQHRRDYSVPGKSTYTDRGTMPLEAGLCDPANPGPSCFLRDDTDPFNVVEKGYGVGFYVQDRWWTPLTWLTLTPGLRFDWGHSTDYLDRPVSTLFGLAPRFGFNADLTQDGRNIFFGYYGRATEPINLVISANTSSTEASVTKTFRWSQADMMWNLDSTDGGPGGIKINGSPKMPHSDEITFGFRREIFPNTVGSVEYTWKRIANTWNLLEENRIWDPTGTRVVDFADPKAAGRTVYNYTTPDDPVWYRGLILSTEGQPSANWEYSASYTLSWTTFLDTADNPRQQQFYKGYSGTDIRHYFRVLASYDLTKDLSMGWTFNYQSGTPLTKGFFNVQDGGYTNYRSPSGTNPSMANDPKAISEFRIPDFMQLDVRLSYDVMPHIWRHRLRLVFDAFNVLNQSIPTGLTASDIARFGQVSARQRPRRIQLGLAYTY
jgi:hypothetical protein